MGTGVLAMEPRLRYGLTLRLYGRQKCFGPGTAALLERVEELASLRQAALHMDMAYSKAWTIIKTAETELGFPLLTRVTGGRGGGGAQLTDGAKRLLNDFRRFESIVRGYADESFYEIFGAY